MTETPDNIIRKIEKCLALSRSSNEHEAAAALRQAHKLMAAYNVTPEGLAAATIGTFNAKTDAWSRPPAWEMQLVGLLKRAFGCDAILYTGYKGKLTEVCYIGIKHQAQLAAYAHEVLRKQADKARAAYTARLTGLTRGSKIASGELFARGYISNIERQITELAVPADQLAARESTKNKLLGITDESEAAKRAYKPARNSSYADADAYFSGQRAGRDASLHRPMAGAAEQLKLGA